MKAEVAGGASIKITYKSTGPSKTFHPAGPPIGLDSYSALFRDELGTSRCLLTPKTQAVTKTARFSLGSGHALVTFTFPLHKEGELTKPRGLSPKLTSRNFS